MFLSRSVRALTAAAAAAVMLTACGSGGDEGGAGDGGNVTLNVNLFGNFGYEELYKEYERANPSVKIKQSTAAYNDHHRNLATHLATKSGASYIEAVDTGFIAQMREVGKQFTDLGTERQSEYLPWKWQASLTKDGQQIA